MKPSILFLCLLLLHACKGQFSPSEIPPLNQPLVGAEQTELYLPLLQDKRVAIVANQTTIIGSAHLVDTLINRGVEIVKVFAPEHGFRGDSGAGEHIADGRDSKTGLPLISLYGKTKKPTAQMLSDVDIILFDIQDVGARFYTYISTMHYVMEAAAESNIAVIILDRPNPNGHYIDGPLLQPAFKSFVGMHPIPIVHGLTIGELAQMIMGERWISSSADKPLRLTVIPCKNYSHQSRYKLPMRPSPNLATQRSIYLYPSLCWYEGTIVSVGRGTDFPFEVIGFPGNTLGKFSFTPRDIPHVAVNPPHEGKSCSGLQFSEIPLNELENLNELHLDWLVDMYRNYRGSEPFFESPDFFDKLCGSDQLRLQLQQGMDAAAIRQSWQVDLKSYKEMRRKYLLYTDFE